FYYDQIHFRDSVVPLRVRSMVGLVPLIAVEVIEQETIDRLPGFRKRLDWFLENRRDLARHIGYMECDCESNGHPLLSSPSRQKLERVLQRVLDEREFLSPFGLRSLSRIHGEEPFVLSVDGMDYR